jgi:NAD(P)-dependent dehydrogenase (short-subunit alcohol dehydrogenase family)
MSKKTILVTGAGSGFGKGAAIGMAKNGHDIIATVQVSSQVTPLREEVKALGLDHIRVERLDLFDPYDIAQAQTWDFDVLWNNAGMGEAGPVWEIPIDLVRKNYEVNVFLPLVLTQGVVRKWVSERKKGKVVFTSSMGGLFTPANWGTYVSTKHALESIAEALQQELKPTGSRFRPSIQVPIIPDTTRPWRTTPSAGSTIPRTSPRGPHSARSSIPSSRHRKDEWTLRK